MLKKLIATALLGLAATAATAGVIDPLTGASGIIKWKNGPVMQTFIGAGNLMTINVAADSTIDFTIDDHGQPGVTFTLYLDNVALAPSAAGAHYEFFDDIFLSGGINHSFTIAVLGANGAGIVQDVSFSAPVTIEEDTPGDPSAVDVPEPASLALFGLGLLALAARRRNKQ